MTTCANHAGHSTTQAPGMYRQDPEPVPGHCLPGEERERGCVKPAPSRVSISCGAVGKDRKVHLKRGKKSLTKSLLENSQQDLDHATFIYTAEYYTAEKKMIP